MNDSNSSLVTPWYKQVWAWFVLTPLIVIFLVCSVLLTIAYKESDDVVIDNYYKEGRMINQRIDEDLLAQQLALKGVVEFDLEVGEVILTIDAAKKEVLTNTLFLYLDHPVEADYDLELAMHKIAEGRYLAALDRRINNRWYLRLSPERLATDDQQFWRVTGEIDLNSTHRLVFGGYE